jgi:hypothetical protein
LCFEEGSLCQRASAARASRHRHTFGHQASVRSVHRCVLAPVHPLSCFHVLPIRVACLGPILGIETDLPGCGAAVPHIWHAAGNAAGRCCFPATGAAADVITGPQPKHADNVRHSVLGIAEILRCMCRGAGSSCCAVGSHLAEWYAQGHWYEGECDAYGKRSH